jgi:hypothetical protein
VRRTAKPGPYPTPGSKKFDELVDERGLSSAEVASEITVLVGKSPPYARATIHNWRHGIARPDTISRAHIALWSRKAVKGGKLSKPTILADDWLVESEREAMAAARGAA